MKRSAITIIVLGVLFGIISGYMFKNNKLEQEVAHLEGYIKTLEQAEVQKEEEFIEGKYTLVMNLSSSIYMNRIPANYEIVHPWTDVNGVSGFDTVEGNMYLRYIEGHIEWPQLSLYAPDMKLEVVSDTKWPEE
jgi:hypothetical protein